MARILGIDFHDGRPCLVREYVSGIPVKEAIATSRAWLMNSGGSPTNDLVSLAGVLSFLLTGALYGGEHDFHQLDRPDIPARIAALCKHALTTPPASAETFAADLETLPRSPLVGRRALVWILLGVIAVGVGALAAWLWSLFH